MKVTSIEYYKGFKSAQGIPAVVALLDPFVKAVCPQPEIAASVYPPLGDAQAIGVVLTFLFLLIATWLVLVICNSVRKVRYIAAYAVLVALIFLGAYCWLATGMGYIHLVRLVNGKTVIVSAGKDRTESAKTDFPGESNYQMLLEHGQREQDIQDLWTKDSLKDVRIRLWSECTLTLITILVLFSLMIYRTVSEGILDSGSAGSASSASRRRPKINNHATIHRTNSAHTRTL